LGAPVEGSTEKTRVAIVGGGCAGLAAAWYLSQQPGYEVHVYEESWRLGGKGASSRDAQGRILDHGLHVWLGFYENAFRMMRECYAEVAARKWGPMQDKPEERLAHGSIDDAFFPEPNIGVAVPDSAGDLNVWTGFLPPAKGLPGEEIDAETNPFTLASYLLRCFELLKALLQSVIGPADAGVPSNPRPDQRSTFDEAMELDFSFDPVRSPTAMIEWIARVLRTGALTTAAGIIQAVTILENWLHTLSFSPQVADSVLQLMEAVAAQTRKQLRDVVAVDEKLRLKTEIIDIVMTIAVGLYRDRVLFDERGLDAINDLDYREWLLKHGATTTSVKSRFMAGIYDLVFAYRDGNHKSPALAAGVALRGALRMFFTYRGSMFWRMRSGMGDAVFAPLYKVLLCRQRKSKPKDNGSEDGDEQEFETVEPVRFHFLHKLSGVDFVFEPKEKRYVKQLTFSTGGDYNELDRLSENALDHFGCWPDDEQVFRDAAKGKLAGRPRELHVGDDFHAVIFAMGIDDFVDVVDKSGLFEKMPPEWQAMRDKVRTVATQAAQVWLERDLPQLGWLRGSGLVTALGMSFDTWADMTHTLATERAWRDTQSDGARRAVAGAAEGARSVAYFCGVLPETEVQRRGTGIGDKVRANLTALLRGEIRPLWPAGFDDQGRPQISMIGNPHMEASTKGSARYTLSLPGSIEHRISPLELSVLNMTIAGDWTACGLDAGCVESAVMSGMLAAHAITGGVPHLNSIIGYNHP